MADWISELPDSLLCHILSFLPTKTAVLTGMLSKRWRLLWTSVPILDLDDDSQMQKNNQFHMGFAKFVDSVLIQHKAQLTIKRFHLKCAYPSCNSLKVKTWVNEATYHKVEQLELYLSPPMRIALPISVYTCSTLVVLKLNGVFENASLPVDLPSLKVLHLGENFSTKNHDSILRFLSGCPVLEILVLDSFKSMMCGCQCCWDDKFGISVPNLVEAKLGFFYSKRCITTISILFKAICNVRFLSISRPTSQEPYAYSNEPEPTWMHTLPIAECLLSHLKSLCFGGYQGLECELEFAGYILKNAKVLGNMTIYSASPSTLMAKHQTVKILSTLPRKSATCQVLFY